MTLRFILGRTGTGKTQRCLDEVLVELGAAPDGAPLVVLVPEQATFQTEHALLASGSVRGFVRAQVLSFGRLAWRVLQETGGATRPVLGDLGKRMILTALLEEHREQLPLFGRLADRPGLAPRLASALHELRAYRVTPGELRERADALDGERGATSTLALKARELAHLAEALDDYCAERFIDPDVYLGLLVARLPRSAQIRGGRVWIDGFAGFTPDELEVIGGILEVAEQVSVTLLLDGEPRREGLDDPTYLFRPSLETYFALRDLAGKRGVRVEQQVVLDDGAAPHRFRATPELAHLEAALARPGKPHPFDDEAPHITIVPAPRRRDEVEAAARECLRLAREEHLRFRDMALVLRDLETYADLIEAVFADYGVPVFVDRRRPIPHHPLVELVRAAVEALAQDFSHETVFRYLRTDLVPVERDVVDRLETYALEHGIRGRAWFGTEPWSFVRRFSLDDPDEAERDPEGSAARATRAQLARLDADRRRAIGALAAMRGRLSDARTHTIRDLAAALWELVEGLGVAAALDRWTEEAEASGRLAAAREHRQAWRGVVSLLDDLVAALGDQRHDLDGFLRILESGLESLDLGLIPPGVDQVVVGTIERSRHLGTRAAFVLGAIDGAYPPQPKEDPIFPDADRERLSTRGLTLGPTARERLFNEAYFAYLTLTRGSRWLWVSHPLADDDGDKLEPARAVRRLAATFPRARRAIAELDQAPIVDAVKPRELGAALARALRVARDRHEVPMPRWLALGRWLASDTALRDQAETAFGALDYEGEFARRTAPLGAELATQLFAASGELRTSVSRLESFTACPFQHFAKHGLALAEPPHATLEPSDLGSLNHAVLSRLVRGLERDHLPWSQLMAADARARVGAIVEELLPRLREEWVLEEPQHRYLLGAVRRVLDGSVELLGEHARRGRFAPVAVELPFGDSGPSASASSGLVLPPMELSLGDGDPNVVLRGRIDRVDAFTDEHHDTWARVIDYKRRTRTLTDTRTFHGLDLQLLAYLLAVTTHGEAFGRGALRPAGALYFPVQAKLPIHLSRPAQDVAANEWRKKSKMTGLVIDDPDVLIAMGAEPSGRSVLLPVHINQDGQTSKRASIASESDFTRLFQHVNRRARRAAKRIVQGDVAVRPFRVGRTDVACSQCRLRPVCQFDPAVEGQHYVDLTPLKTGELLTKLGEESGDGQPE